MKLTLTNKIDDTIVIFGFLKKIREKFLNEKLSF